MGKDIKLYRYNAGDEVSIEDLMSPHTADNKIPIDYIRATGEINQFITCSCDDTDDVKIWDCIGDEVKLKSSQRIGQLGNLGLVTAKTLKFLVVPGKSPELRIYKANVTPNKRGEYLEKLYFVKAPGNESHAAGISNDGYFLSATDGKSIYGWRLNERDDRMDKIFTIESSDEVSTLDVIRPVCEDNYHNDFAVVAYATGKILNIVAYKKEDKEYVKIGEDSVQAHNGSIKIIRLAIFDKKIIVFTTAYDKCLKIWKLPEDWFPPCALNWNA